MKKLLTLLFALLAAPAAAQVIPSGPNGSINYWGPSGSSQVLVPGTAGQCLTTQGTTGAPVWVNCQVSSLSLLPPINTNQFYGNVSGQFAPPVGVDVNTVLNTVGYDIVRPPTPESIIYKSNVGPLFNWQSLPPGASGAILTSGGPTNPPFWATSTASASLAAICQTIGAILYFDTPSLQWKCLNPGTAGQVLRTGGTNGNPSWLTIAPSATTDTTNASNIITGTLAGTLLPTPAASVLGGIFSATAPANQFMTGVNTSGAPTFAQPAFSNLSGTLGSAQFGPLTGDVTTSGYAATISANAVTNAKLAQASADTVQCNPTGSTANVQNCATPVVTGLSLLGSTSADALDIVENLSGTNHHAISVAQTVTGNLGNGYDFNLFNITSDNVQCAGTAGQFGFCNGLRMAWSFGGAAMTGGRQGIFSTVQLTAPSSATNQNRNYVSGAFRTDALSSDNGTNTGAGALGAIFAMNPIATLQASATNFLELSGGEVDFGMDSTASTKYMLGWSLVSGYNGLQNGSGAAAVMGAGVSVSAGAVAQTLDAAYIVTDLNGGWPIKTAGSLQKAFITTSAPTVANGTDWSAVTFTGCAFKSSNFCVTPVGIVQGSLATFNGNPGATASANLTVKNVHATAGDFGMLVAAGLVTDSSSFIAVFQDAVAFGVVGSISRSGTGVAYNVSSDKRLKIDHGVGSKGLNDLMAIKVHDFAYKSNPGGIQEGYFAQELYQTYPEAVTVGGDDPAVKPWQVDYGRLTPLLVKSTQDMQHEVEALSSRVASLEHHASSRRRSLP